MIEPYHKIHTIFKRDPATKHKTLLVGEYSRPEFGYLWDNIWGFTEKVDGTNIRVISLSSGDVVFGGRTNNEQLPAKLVEQLSKLFPRQDRLHEQFPDGACLYGEGYGAGIQKGGGNYSSTQQFVLFDIRVGNWWLERKAVAEVADALGITIVPRVGRGTLTDAVRLVKNGFRSRWGDFIAEGIVMRPTVELFGRNGKRVIAKLKCKDFTGVE
ncbi:MAG: hypothetical protein GY906_23910 [bacterium]|nr:hypothetical protein [bacterium]